MALMNKKGINVDGRGRDHGSERRLALDEALERCADNGDQP